ncbi:MAG: dihydroorotate dehydrogenase electron transfer subunit [Desulfovibrio sp.]|nr:dihydroorotate dehydrogenase electron transfer subunit [Desulfovibrio sp.]
MNAASMIMRGASPAQTNTGPGMAGGTSALVRLEVLDIAELGWGGPGFFVLRLSQPGWEHPLPGRFLMLRATAGSGEYLCARPFSICRINDDGLVVFFQVRGKATRDFAALKPGDPVDAWGPLGNSLPVDPCRPVLVLAGGVGIAPFVNYVDRHPVPGSISLEFGHRLPLECYPLRYIEGKCSIRTHHEKNDGDRAVFSMLVEERIREFALSGIVLACGPPAFLRLVRELALKYRAEAWLSLETRMACGIGACLGCAVKTLLPAEYFAAPAQILAAPPSEGDREHYVQTCLCGPNFRADRVLL